MVVLNGIHTVCMDCGNINEMPGILHTASEIMTGFVSMASCKKMSFPIRQLMAKIKCNFPDCTNNDRLLFLVKIREMSIYNGFELYIKAFESANDIKSIDEINADFDYVSLGTFNSIPIEEEKKE